MNQNFNLFFVNTYFMDRFLLFVFIFMYVSKLKLNFKNKNNNFEKVVFVFENFSLEELKELYLKIMSIILKNCLFFIIIYEY